MLLLSLLSRHESTQSERVRHAALFDIQSIPEYAEVLPENTITTGGTISEAVVPSEAAFLPMTDVSQIFGAG